MVKELFVKAVAGVTVLVVPLLVWAVVGVAAYDVALHNLQARWLERQVAELTHLGDSDLVASLLDVGRLGGGNVPICEALAGEVRRSELTGAEIREFYQRASAGSNEPHIYVFDEPLSEANHIPIAYRMAAPGGAAHREHAPGLLYAVYYYDSPDTLGADARCW